MRFISTTCEQKKLYSADTLLFSQYYFSRISAANDLIHLNGFKRDRDFGIRACKGHQLLGRKGIGPRIDKGVVAGPLSKPPKP